MERTVLHSDLNNFFASVECFLDPSLNGHPVAVTGDPELRHGIILAKNYEAKKYNIKTGEPIFQAKQKCPDLVCVRPHYDKYAEFSAAAKKIYSDYTDLVESYGIDECWLDVTHSRRLFGDGKKVADEIRSRIKRELGITVSVGVSFNKVFAKLGSDMKKPDATTVIDIDHFKEIVWPLPVGDLLYVGRASGVKLRSYGIDTIGKLAVTPLETMRYFLGKTGEMLWNFANGYDMSPVSNIAAKSLLKSVSCGNTSHRDLVTDEDIRCALYPLCTKVSERLRKYGFRCRTVALSVRDFQLSSYERRCKLIVPCRTSREIFNAAYGLFLKNHKSGKPVRSLSVQASDLIYTEEEQLSLDPEIWKIQKREILEREFDLLNERYGKNTIYRALLMTDPEIAGLHVHSGKENILPGRIKM